MNKKKQEKQYDQHVKGGFILPIIINKKTKKSSVDKYKKAWTLIGGGRESYDKTGEDCVLRECTEESLGLFATRKNKNFKKLEKMGVEFKFIHTVDSIKKHYSYDFSYKKNGKIKTVLYPIFKDINLDRINSNYELFEKINDDHYSEITNLGFFSVDSLYKLIRTGVLYDENNKKVPAGKFLIFLLNKLLFNDEFKRLSMYIDSMVQYYDSK